MISPIDPNTSPAVMDHLPPAQRARRRGKLLSTQIVSTERGVVLATKFLWYVSEKARSDAGFFMSDGGGRGRAQADLMPAQPEPFASVRQGEAACNLYNIATNMMRGRREEQLRKAGVRLATYLMPHSGLSLPSRNA